MPCLLFVFIFLPLQFCWGHGGHLAEFSTENKESLIDLYLPEHIWYWIGLTDETEEGILYFIFKICFPKILRFIRSMDLGEQ